MEQQTPDAAICTHAELRWVAQTDRTRSCMEAASSPTNECLVVLAGDSMSRLLSDGGAGKLVMCFPAHRYWGKVVGLLGLPCPRSRQQDEGFDAEIAHTIDRDYQQRRLVSLHVLELHSMSIPDAACAASVIECPSSAVFQGYPDLRNDRWRISARNISPSEPETNRMMRALDSRLLSEEEETDSSLNSHAFASKAPPLHHCDATEDCESSSAIHSPAMPESQELAEQQPLLSPCIEKKIPQYTETTPFTEPKNGALREGKPPDMFSRESFGLLSQFAAVGLVSGVLPGVIYPVLQGYLNAEGTIVVSATLLVQLPWSFKVFFGILSDCFPIFGYRRRPYMIVGWVFCCIMLFYMAGLYVPAPYYGDPSMHFSNPDDWTEAQQATINKNAPDAAGQYVVPMMLAAFGYLVAEVAADAMVVEHAQREPLATRGQIQAAIHTVRMTFNAVGGLLVAVAFNGVEYGGHFDFSLTFPQMMLILGCLCLPLLPITWIFLHEEQVPDVRFAVYIRRFWEVIQQRAVYQIAAYKFLSGVFNNFNIVSSSNIKFHWVHATPFNSSVMVIAGTLVYACTLGLTGKFGLQWNWRVSIAVTVVLGVIIDGFMTMLTTWDIIRNQWFWLGVPIVGYIPDGVRFIVANYVVVELIETGYEGALYGLLTTTSNLATPFGRTAAKLINARFQVWVEDIMRDTYEVRRDVTITICICYGMKLVSLAFLPLLPRQKAETQAIKRYGGKSKLMGTITVTYLGVALVWSTVVNLLSMFEATKCWKITGGCAPDRS